MAAKKLYPPNLLAPVGSFLTDQLRSLEKRRKSVMAGDPFSNSDRTEDNASPDADAEEQDGHARTMAVREQLDRKIIQTRKALAKIKVGEYGICEKCGNMIDTDRLMIYPEATLCTSCQKQKESQSRR